MTNPLLHNSALPEFSLIKPEHVRPAIEQIISDNEQAINELLSSDAPWTWETLQLPLDQLEDRLAQAWSPVSHMNAVVNSEALREAYNECLPMLSEYATKMGQNRKLYEAFRSLRDSEDFLELDSAQQKIINDTLRDFKLAGVALDDDKKQTFASLKKALANLSSKYSDNVLDANMAWTKLVEQPFELAGMPESAVQLAQQQAQAKGLAGYLLTLDIPCYLPVMTYCENRTLRQEIYTAFTTRASDQGPNAGQFDNTHNMEAILANRHELAQLLGFANYAEYSLATKMADSTDHVMGFLEDLAHKSRAQGMQELTELKDFAKTQFGVDTLESWDVAFYAEKLRQQRYDVSQEALRPWFPAERAISGMFTLVSRLFNVEFSVVDGVDVWHPSVTFYQIRRGDTVLGSFYLDLYAREHKRGGAWMDVCRSRWINNGTLQNPVAYLTCNFTPPVGDKSALLTHDEVVTLFHEFGHGLHHMLTQVDHLSASGINGVAWDAVELPSQFMENWCWEKEGLEMISGHYETGEPLPDDMLQKLLAAKNFQSAMAMLRQLEFALFDFKLHRDYDKGVSVQAVLDNVREEVAVMVPPRFNRFQNSFSHIFAGGYAAGYYSYKWAEVLSADAFSRFEEEGIFNQVTGESFLHEILEKGGSADPMALFTAFRGREPSNDALLRHSDIK